MLNDDLHGERLRHRSPVHLVMRWLAILAILTYRIVVRPFRHRFCLYDESCSAYGIRLLRESGLTACGDILARIRSCRMPASACFILDEHGKAQLLSAYSHDGSPLPARALEILAARAEHYATVDHKLGD